ncbi:neurabin-1-like isoform X2 [Centruroides vittatus]|uniref:neurabin-1-like isoform X2 n=1 Tax=Centruroides vittatus TaxID=120091 RepID=UPI0035101484
MFERLQDQTKKISKSVAATKKGNNLGSTEFLSTSSPTSDVSSHSSFTPSPINSNEDNVTASVEKLCDTECSVFPKCNENITENHCSDLIEKTENKFVTDSKLKNYLSKSADTDSKDRIEMNNDEVMYEKNKANNVNLTNLSTSSFKITQSSYCNGLLPNSDENCVIINPIFSQCENTFLSENISSSLNSESKKSSSNMSSMNSTSQNHLSSSKIDTEESAVINESKIPCKDKKIDTSSAKFENHQISVDKKENHYENKEIIMESDKVKEPAENTNNSHTPSANLETLSSSEEVNVEKFSSCPLPNGYTSSIKNDDINEKIDCLTNNQIEKKYESLYTYDDDALQVIDGDIIDIIPRDSISDSKPQLYLPDVSEQLLTQNISVRNLYSSSTLQFTKELTRRVNESSDNEESDKKIDCNLSSWINSQHVPYKDWEKEYETSEPSTDHEDSQIGSPYENSGSLRDSAGETLAEFECREHELFLVEAVLESDDQNCQSGPFPSPPGEKESSVDVELMTQEEADKLLSKSSRQSLLSDEEAREVVLLLTRQQTASNSDLSETGSLSAPSSMYEAGEEEDLAGEAICDTGFSSGTSVVYEDIEYHLLPDGHYFIEQPGLGNESDDDEMVDYCNIPARKRKVKFSCSPIKVFSTYSVEEYDRRNDDVDPVSASAEYELEKRIEKMDVFPVNIMKGPEGLGLSIIGMGVGADAGLEKLGIFVKTVTEGGAAHKDNRIHVSDQIIEVDGKSLVGVTQAYAASVLRNTSGMVRFLIGREKDAESSEIALLISQSLQADRERAQHQAMNRISEKLHQEEIAQGCESSSLSQDSTPEEGEDGPTVEVFDLANDSSDSVSPDMDVETLRIKLREAQYKNAIAEAELRKVKEKLMALERIESERIEFLRQLEAAQLQLQEAERTLQATCQEMNHYRQMLEESQGQFISLERKYIKAKKLIKEFQQREQDFLHQEEFHIQQLQEKDHEYNALVKALKDRVILLEHDLIEMQKTAGLPVQLPYNNNNMKQITSQIKREISYTSKPRIATNISLLKKLEIDVSDGELSDGDVNKYALSPDEEDEENSKRSTVERKPIKEDCFDRAVPQTELLDISAAKAKAELASKGSLANRQPPSLKKQSSNGSMELSSPGERSSESSLCDDSEDEIILRIHAGGNSEETNQMEGSSDSVFVLTAEHIQFSSLESSALESSGNISSVSSLNCHSKPLTFVEEIKAAVLERQAKDAEAETHEKDVKRMCGPNAQKNESGSYEEGTEKDRKAHHWQSGPVHQWTANQVGQWLLALGLEQYIPKFVESDVTGQILLQVDSARLKVLGVASSGDRSLIKKKVKEMRSMLEKERKAHVKEQKAREKQQKKAEKASKKK